MTEMLASLMSRKNMKEEIAGQLHLAFIALIKEAYPASGKFFISSNPFTKTSELTYHAVKAINLFERMTDGAVKGLKQKSLRDYFVTKAETSEDMGQITDSLKALEILVAKNKLPFIQVVEGQTLELGGEGSITLQFLNQYGDPVSVRGRTIKQVELDYTIKTEDGDSYVDVTDLTTLDESSGKMQIQIKEGVKNTKAIRKGACKINVALEDKATQETFRVATAQTVKFET